MIESVLSELTFATDRFCGNPNELVRIHDVASRLVTERYPNASWIVTECVPSANEIPLTVLTVILFGVERYPIESRIVTVCPGYKLGRKTTAFANCDVSTSITLVDAVTVIDAIPI